MSLQIEHLSQQQQLFFFFIGIIANIIAQNIQTHQTLVSLVKCSNLVYTVQPALSPWESEHFFCAFRKLLCCSWLVIYWFLFLCWHMQLYIYTFVSRFIRWSFFFQISFGGGKFYLENWTWSILCEEKSNFAAVDN